MILLKNTDCCFYSSSIRLPNFERTGPHCLTFKYYMWGFHINQLSVFKEDNSLKKTEVWDMKGQQKDMWLTGQVNISLENGDRVRSNHQVYALDAYYH